LDDDERRYTLNSVLNKKFSARFSLRSRTTIEALHLTSLTRNLDNIVFIPDAKSDLIQDNRFTSREIYKVILLPQLFTQAEYRFVDQLSVAVGIHVQYLGLSEDLAVEPGLAASWHLNPNNELI
jgi:hypothetical protein